MASSKNPKSTVTTAEAASIIGCSPQQVRTLIRQGKLRAERVKNLKNPAGYNLNVFKEDAKKYSKTVPPKGWQRGRKRR